MSLVFISLLSFFFITFFITYIHAILGIHINHLGCMLLVVNERNGYIAASQLSTGPFKNPLWVGAGTLM